MPITVKATRTADGEGDGTTERQDTEIRFTRFVYRARWFVLSQTDGAAYTPEPVPGWDAQNALANLNIHMVPFTHLDGNIQGYAKARDVAINPVADQPEATLFHEVAHILLDHTAEAILSDSGRDRTPADIRELEAECVALLCCETLGLPGADLSRGYIQSWFKGGEVPERSAQRILHVASEILKAGSR